MHVSVDMELMKKKNRNLLPLYNVKPERKVVLTCLCCPPIYQISLGSQNTKNAFVLRKISQFSDSWHRNDKSTN